MTCRPDLGTWVYDERVVQPAVKLPQGAQPDLVRHDKEVPGAADRRYSLHW